MHRINYCANLHFFLKNAKKNYYFCLMLQRIQSVWMLLSVLGSAFLFVTAQDLNTILFDGFVSGAAIVLVLLGLFSIFNFKSRLRQLLLNYISIIINVLLIGVLVYGLLNLSGGIAFPEKGIEPIFPLLSVICLLIANHYIRKDDKLVKSVDRLR